MAQLVATENRTAEVLDAAAAFYSEYLWTTEIGEAIRARLAGEGVEDETIRAFEVGYIPGEHGLLEDHLSRRGFAAEELYEAGLARRSRRGRVHSQFRSRIMFPIRDLDGGVLGFAGMATNPGPSWPLWLISPDRGRFDKRSAIFALDRASAAIGEEGRALVFRDCLDVLRAHQAGEREAVALIRASMTPQHLEQLAPALGVPPAAVGFERNEDSADVVTGSADATPSRDGLQSGAGTGGEEQVRRSGSELRPDPKKARSPAQRVVLQIARVAFGVGIPLIWLAILQPDLEATGGADPAFIGALGAVAGTYVVLAIVSSLAAAQVRSRSRARRMRSAWDMGAGEWQPLAWTYHMLEDILVAAAVISAVVCIAMFVAIGGFTN